MAKKCWYCLTYQGKSTVDQQSCTASVYCGVAERYITKGLIDSLKADAKVDAGAVLVACSYLGRMSREKFNGETL